MRLHPTFFDLLFSVLFLFIVVATMAGRQSEAREETLPPIRLPELEVTAQAGSTERKSPVVTISVRGKRTLYSLDGEERQLTELPEALASSYPGSEIIIRADKTVPYGQVMALIGGLRQHGLNSVALAFLPEQGGK